MAFFNYSYLHCTLPVFFLTVPTVLLSQLTRDTSASRAWTRTAKAAEGYGVLGWCPEES